MKNKKTLNLISLGCAKNLVDSEILLGGLDKTNVTITKDPEQADTIVVNTCGFLDIAREESVDTILQAAEMKRTGSLKELVAMGCLSERYPAELKKEIPEVDRSFGSNDHQQIVSFLTGKEFAKDDPLFFRSLMTPNHYAYIKIAEGCDNGCSFCSIPLMRGLQKSRTISSIMDEAERLAENGTKELLVIAQDSTSYGWDLEKKVYLSDLLKELNTIKGIEWIRVHYAHPAHLSQRIIDAIANCDKVCIYLPQKELVRKGVSNIDSDFLKHAFGNKNIHVIRNKSLLKNWLLGIQLYNTNLLLMSSGNFSNLNIEKIFK